LSKIEGGFDGVIRQQEATQCNHLDQHSDKIVQIVVLDAV